MLYLLHLYVTWVGGVKQRSGVIEACFRPAQWRLQDVACRKFFLKSSLWKFCSVGVTEEGKILRINCWFKKKKKLLTLIIWAAEITQQVSDWAEKTEPGIACLIQSDWISSSDHSEE